MCNAVVQSLFEQRKAPLLKFNHNFSKRFIQINKDKKLDKVLTLNL